MREHRYQVELPHSAERLWALMQDYDRWTAYAPMVLRVEVLWPGDAHGNGLLRRVSYRLPFGRQGTALELVSEVEPARGYRYRMLSREPGNDQTGRVRLEPLGARAHATTLRGALPPGVGAVALVRGADLPLHQPPERSVDAPPLGVAHDAPGVPPGSGGLALTDSQISASSAGKTTERR